MKVFTPRRLREISEIPQEGTAKTAKTPEPTAFGSFGGEGQGGSTEKTSAATPTLTRLETVTSGPPIPDSVLRMSASSVPRLPESLERLVRAASSDALPIGVMKLETGIAPDFKLHVLAWSAAYLCGDTNHALERLHVAHRAWVVSKGLN